MAEKQRFESLDQFRGFAVFTMILVNVLGRFLAMPDALKHSRVGFSFADTVAPFFVFIVGTGFRLSYTSNVAKLGKKTACLKAIRRLSLLTLMGLILYAPYFSEDFIGTLCKTYWQIDIWDALVNIGLAGILSMVVIGNSSNIRIITAMSFLILFQVICDQTFYGEWLHKYSIDGGPLGLFGWAFILLFGSLITDFLKQSRAHITAKCLIWGLLLISCGLVLSRYWFFSKWYLSCSYVVASTGLGFLVFLAFYYLSDVWRRPLPHLTVLGKNALIIYFFHQIARTLFFASPIFNEKSNILFALASFVTIYVSSYSVALYCDKNNYRIPL